MILAPMQGLTELLFRKVYEQCFPGAISYAISPFISLTHGNLTEAWKKIDDVWPEANNGSMTVVPQILGKEIEEFTELANRLYDIGYEEVNWNIGCPMRAITGKHRGSGILPYPDEIEAILDGVVPHLKPRLSIKMRLGLRDKDEILAIVPLLNRYPLASVTIHPRTGRQQYTGVADEEQFGKVAPLINAPVIYNGDICTVADAQRIMRKFPYIQDIMVGRGIFYSPMLPIEVTQGSISPETKLVAAKQLIRRLTDEIMECMPSEQAKIRKIKEYWCLLWRSLDISESTARQLLRQEELAAVTKLIYSFTQ